MPGISESELIEDVERRLLGEYADLPQHQVSEVIARALDRFADSPIREFVPLLVERRVRAELSGLQSTPAWST